ncbi:putative 4-hydroxy-4-methyl-2-oxoglutarate aldolase, partial [Xanthomonas oryzae pv. oryzae]
MPALPRETAPMTWTTPDLCDRYPEV